MKKIPLTQGKFALVDDEDYDFLMQWKWCYDSRGYAKRSANLGSFCGKQKAKTILMHRIINKTPDGFDTDHRDGDKLNNQKSNLRDATRGQNQMNKKSQPNKTSLFKGVSWQGHAKKWCARITVEKKVKYLGHFDCEVTAGLAYNAAAVRYHGAYAYINKI